MEPIDYNEMNDIRTDNNSVANLPIFIPNDFKNTQTFSGVPVDKKPNPFDDMLVVKGVSSYSYFINIKGIDYIKIEDDILHITFKNNYLSLDLKENPHIKKMIKERLEK